MKNTQVLLLSVLFLTLITSCRKDEPEVVWNTGVVAGYVVAPNTAVPISYARAWIEFQSTVYETRSNESGYFELEAPVGTHTLHIETGDGDIFGTTLQVTIILGETTIVGGETGIVLDCRGELAYITGEFDEIETLIIDSLGYTAIELTVEDLADPANLVGIAALFLNCGKDGSLDSAKYAHLEAFVAGGGSIYVSDFAVEYLTGDGYWFLPSNNNSNERTSLQKHLSGNKIQTDCEDIGGFISDDELCTSKEGIEGTYSDVSVVAADLAAFLGASTVELVYDLPGWEFVNTMEAPWEVIIQDDLYGNGPLAARRSYGYGQLYFTTFHNHPDGLINEDTENILNFFILNL